MKLNLCISLKLSSYGLSLSIQYCNLLLYQTSSVVQLDPALVMRQKLVFVTFPGHPVSGTLVWT